MKAAIDAVACLACVALLAALAACEVPAPSARYPEITFAHLEPIKLDVARVEFVQEYVPPLAPPNVEHLFPVLPSAVARRWSDDRIEAAGIARHARVVLVDAAVTETALDIRRGVRGLFWNEQSARYDAAVEVRIDILDDGGETLGQVRATARRSRTVPEDITLNQRDQVWFELTEALMTDLDAALESAIRRHLARFVR